MFAVPVADLERGPKRVQWSIPEPWLRGVLADTDAKSRGSDGVVELELTKNGREVLVRGRARVELEVRCVVTDDPLPWVVEPEVVLLLAPPAPTRGPRRDKSRARRGPETPRRGKRGGGRWGDDPELSEEDAGRDHFDGEQVVLDDYLRQFILLELPASPRRPDLPSAETPAIPPAPEPENQARLDPRLVPLVAIKNRLVEKKE